MIQHSGWEGRVSKLYCMCTNWDNAKAKIRRLWVGHSIGSARRVLSIVEVGLYLRANSRAY